MDGCIIHLLIHMVDILSENKKNPFRAALTIPGCWLAIGKSGIAGAGEGVWAIREVPMGIKFGPYEGINKYKEGNGQYSWEVNICY